MSYSCLNMDDLQSDDTLLQNINLCLENENDELKETDIPSFQYLDNVLLAFDLFRGSYSQEISVGINLPTGFVIPFQQANYLNQFLYQSFDTVLGSNRENLYLFFYNFIDSFFKAELFFVF